MRTYEVEYEEIDDDVCLGDYDSTRRIGYWYISMFEDGERVDGMGLRTEAGAEEIGKIFVDGGSDAVYMHRELKRA